ncbi:DUF2147 domain-containing protein [Psychroserpens sp. Hel_I_66]|uniref:DUF2147 domain-containing protein n=1 Tax=Psychroserpens sp. Hel_I_66 TaxID=1250004 RepID=UPI0006456D5B|nr:DUF2147 domain-containing protein [Psychroserpens sp. Hel_I_66]
MNKFTIIITLLVSINLNSQTVFGKWKTVDDKSGEEKSIVEIYKEDGKVYGKIIEIFDESKRDLPCKFCEGEDENKPILGLDIIKGLEKSGDVYKNGTVTNPENGKTYDCRIKLDEDDPDRLQLRGYVSFFYRTQYWIRVN